MMDPEPFPEAMVEMVTAGSQIPEGVTLTPVPDRVDRRLPHSRRGTVWAASGTWMLEVDAVRSRIILVAHDVLPPDI
jgi:hypothetical protein